MQQPLEQHSVNRWLSPQLLEIAAQRAAQALAEENAARALRDERVNRASKEYGRAPAVKAPALRPRLLQAMALLLLLGSAAFSYLAWSKPGLGGLAVSDGIFAAPASLTPPRDRRDVDAATTFADATATFAAATSTRPPAGNRPATDDAGTDPASNPAAGAQHATMLALREENRALHERLQELRKLLADDTNAGARR